VIITSTTNTVVTYPTKVWVDEAAIASMICLYTYTFLHIWESSFKNPENEELI